MVVTGALDNAMGSSGSWDELSELLIFPIEVKGSDLYIATLASHWLGAASGRGLHFAPGSYLPRTLSSEGHSWEASAAGSWVDQP